MNSILQDIEELRSIVRPFIAAHPSKSMPIVEWTFLHALERVDRNLHSIHTLVKEDLEAHEHGIGLLSRNLLSDFLIIGHAVRSSTQLTIEAELMPLFRSDIEKVEAHEERYNRNKQFTTEEYLDYPIGGRLNRTIGDIVADYYKANPEPIDPAMSCPHCKTKRPKKVTKKRWDSNADIAEKAMKMKPPSALAVNLWRAYDQWFYYSKYEHIGWHSFVLTRSNTVEMMEARLRRILLRTSVLMGLCFDMLEHREELERSMSIVQRLFNETPIPADKESDPGSELGKDKPQT
ncbi:MAG: hypothetical protein IPO05_19245 [Flavobacteriales bacterium]|jgi:hypothetical protein|nr:hypothetical protein [Flavobacteriales bacterium]MBK9515686.1 hypothetical protein [Flavobacteriales bacterium]HOZ41432.1 hypothetical protein [Flavobacteriales bacterium]